MTLIKSSIYSLMIIAASLTNALAEETGTPDTGTIVPVELSNPIALGLNAGVWYEYSLTGGPNDGATVRWTWLETEEHAGQSYQWFETQLSTPNRTMVTRLLANPAQLREPPRIIVMQVDDNPAQSMPRELGQKAVELLNHAGQSPAKSVSDVTVDVAAGTYETRLYSVNTSGVSQSIHISEALPGIVLNEAKGFRMELVRTGTDGKSAINGSVTTFKSPQPNVSREASP